MPSTDFKQKEVLIQKAKDLSESHKYLESAHVYSRLNRLYRETWSRVVQLENLRMAGALTKKSFRRSDTVKKFRETLGPEGATNLVVEFLNATTSRRKIRRILRVESFSSEAELEVLAKKALKLRKSKQILREQNYLEGKLNFTKYLGVTVFRKRKLLYLPPLKVLNGRSPRPKFATIRNPKSLVLRNAVFTSSSDAIKVGSTWLIDSATFPQSSSDSYSCDSLLLGRARLKVALRHDVKAYSTLQNMIFLAYPLTSSWGHWVIEVLTRIAHLRKKVDLNNFELLICDDVPENFTDVACEIFGDLNFTRIQKGQSVQGQNAIVQLATHHQKKRFFASKRGGKNAYLDWRSFNLLREAISDKESFASEGDNEFQPNVYLDRINNKYRKSESVSNLREVMMVSRFIPIDPGTLSAKEEMRLFIQVRQVVAFFGSQALLLFASRNLNKVIFVHHDLLDEALSYSHMIKKVTGVTPYWISGSRINETKVYSEHSIHQGVSLATEELNLIRDLTLQS